MTASKIPSSPVRTVTMPTPVEKLSFASNEKDKDMQVKIETAQKLDAKVKEEKMQVKIEIAQNDKKPQPNIINVNGIEYIKRSEVEIAQNDKNPQPGINLNGIEYIRRSESQSTTATTRESFTLESLESASYRSRPSRNVGHIDLTKVDDSDSSVIIDLTDDDIVPFKFIPVKEEEQYVGMKRKHDVILIT